MKLDKILILLFLYIFITNCASQKELLKDESETKAVFSFIFDDLNTSDTLIKNLFDEYNFKPSFALISSKLDSTSAVIYKSYYNEGISILSHSISHPRMNDSLFKEETIDYELKFSKQDIEKYGINVSGFVTPYSKMHPKFLKLLENYYEYSFTNNSKNRYDKTINKYSLSRYGIKSNISKLDHSIDIIKRRIDAAIENEELLVFYGHKLPSGYKDNLGNARVNSNDLRRILLYLKEKTENKECKVLTSDLAISEYYK